MESIKGKSLQIALAGILLIAAYLLVVFIAMPFWASLLIFLVPYLVSSFDVFKEAFESFKEKEIFNESFLMIIATIGALLIGFIPNANSECLEAVFVMLFFQVGELFEIIAEGKSKKSINALMQIRPDFANIQIDGNVVKIDPKDVKIGEIIIVNPGEKIPLDGIVEEGQTSLNTIALTGESIPKSVDIGDEVFSGCVNISGLIKIKVTKLFGESTASKIIKLVENATENKSKSDKFITKFSKYYTPIVVLLAVLLAVVPSIITGEFSVWIMRALTFLVVSCPCALVISVPLSYFGGIGCASKYGILIKGANYLELMSKVDTLVFDKTGTLTEGCFEIVAVHPEKFSKKELLHLATHVEYHSNHPIAQSLKQYYNQLDNINDNCKIEEIEEMAGYGVKAKVNDETIYVGNQKLMEKININYQPCENFGTIIHISSKSEYFGHIVIADKLKEDSQSAVKEFSQKNIKTILLTGDKFEVAKNVAKQLNINEYYADLLPQQKLEKIQQVMQTKNKNSVLAFVGDGINDAPSLARADIGISMGAMGSDAAIEASDIVLMDDKISKINTAINISKKTQTIVKENIVFALVVKFAVLGLAGFGFAPMLLAVFADVGVTVLAVLNSIRALKIKNKSKKPI